MLLSDNSAPALLLHRSSFLSIPTEHQGICLHLKKKKKHKIKDHILIVGIGNKFLFPMPNRCKEGI